MSERAPNTPPAGQRRPRDPWAEQARRREGATRRRRSRVWIASGIVVAVAAAIVVTLLASDRDAVAPTDSASPVTLAADSSRAATTPSPSASIVQRPGPVDRPVELREVWFVQQVDGSYDWGVTIGSVADADRGPIEVVATFLDGAGDTVASAGESIRRLAGGAAASVGGSVVDPAGAPDRVEVDVSQGEELTTPGAAPDDVQIVAVQRRRMPAAGDDGAPPESIIGRLRTTTGEDLEDLRLALLWRDGGGDVVASVFEPIERVRPGIDARFEVPLPDGFVGEGPPDDVSWSYGPAEG